MWSHDPSSWKVKEGSPGFVDRGLFGRSGHSVMLVLLFVCGSGGVVLSLMGLVKPGATAPVGSRKCTSPEGLRVGDQVVRRTAGGLPACRVLQSALWRKQTRQKGTSSDTVYSVCVISPAGGVELSCSAM